MMHITAIPGVLAACSVAVAQSTFDPYVVLSSDPGGDFGPGTAGTTTAGWQEALDYCVANDRDLYVKGGYGAQEVFHVTDTIVFPPMRDFRIDGGVYVINDQGLAPSEPIIRFDSAINCSIELGIIVYAKEEQGIVFKPENPVDDQIAFTENKFATHGIAGPFPFIPGDRGGTGLVYDATLGPISHNDFLWAAVLNFGTQIDISGDFSHNTFVCEHLHTNSNNSTLMVMDSGTTKNTFRLGIGVDQGATGVTGVRISGVENSFNIASRGPFGSGFLPGRCVVFDPSAARNEVLLRNNQPLSEITDNATAVDNRVTWTGDSEAIVSIFGTVGSWDYTQRLFPAMVHIEEQGGLTSATIQRPSGGVLTYFFPEGRDVFLEVGDTLTITGNSSPQIKVIGIK